MGLDTGYEDIETDELIKMLDDVYANLHPSMYEIVSKIVNMEIELQDRSNV